MVADVRELPFDAGTFDVVFDKGEYPNHAYLMYPTLVSGTMDAMMTAKGDIWVIAVNTIYISFLKLTDLRTHRIK